MARHVARPAEPHSGTALALAQLPAAEWTVLHDVPVPGPAGARVDHIVVGAPGIFVVASLGWSRRVQVRRHVLRHNGRLRQKALGDAEAGAAAVASLLDAGDAAFVHPVACFERDDQIMGWGRHVMVCSRTTLVPMLEVRPAVLSDVRRRALRDLLAARVRPPGPMSVSGA